MNITPPRFFFLRRRCDQAVTRLPRRLGKNFAVDEPKRVALFVQSIVGDLGQHRPAWIHLFVDITPHRFGFGDVGVGV
jgi:hypothetical protein